MKYELFSSHFFWLIYANCIFKCGMFNCKLIIKYIYYVLFYHVGYFTRTEKVRILWFNLWNKKNDFLRMQAQNWILTSRLVEVELQTYDTFTRFRQNNPVEKTLVHHQYSAYSTNWAARASKFVNLWIMEINDRISYWRDLLHERLWS